MGFGRSWKKRKRYGLRGMGSMGESLSSSLGNEMSSINRNFIDSRIKMESSLHFLGEKETTFSKFSWIGSQLILVHFTAKLKLF